LNRTVSIRKCKEYEGEAVRKVVKTLFGDLGGESKFFKKGQRVLLKPNFLVADPKQKGIITHPLVTRAVAEIALEEGCKVKIGDSPGLGSVKNILEKSGFKGFFDDIPVELLDFRNSVEIKNEPERRFRRFDVEREVLEADFIVNIPKVKSHGQMMMTLAVKNMFGCVVD